MVRRTLRVLVVLPVVLVLSGACSDRGLSRSEAAGLLGQEYTQKWEGTCSHFRYDVVAKPEFADLFDHHLGLGSVQVVVKGIQKVSDTAMVAEVDLVCKANSGASAKWLAAFDALERRLQTLPPTQYSGDHMVRIDPADKLTYNSYRGAGPGITDTTEWKDLQELKQPVITLAEKGEWKMDSLKATFVLYDDGWRLRP